MERVSNKSIQFKDKYDVGLLRYELMFFFLKNISGLHTAFWP